MAPRTSVCILGTAVLLAACAPFGRGGPPRLMDPAAGCGVPRGPVRPVPAPRWVARSPGTPPRAAPDTERVVPRWSSRAAARSTGCIFCDYTDKGVEPTRALRFTDDGRRLVVGGDRRFTTVWDLQTGAPITALEPSGGEGFPFVQAISPDGRFVSERAKDTLELWSTTERARAHRLSGHRSRCEFCDAVNAAAFDPTGAIVATGDDAGALRLWRVADGRLLRAFGVGHGELVAIAFSPDRRLVATASDDEAAVRLLDVDTGELFGVFPTEEDELRYVSWSADGRRLAAADFTESLAVWDLDRCRRIAPRDRPRGREGWHGFLTGLALTPRGELLVGSFGDDGLAVWDTRTGTRALLVEPLDDDTINEVAISPGGELLATGTALGTVLWRLPTLEPLVFLAQSATMAESAYVVDLVRPEADVDVFGSPAEPWPEVGGRFEAFGGGEALLHCRRGRAIADVAGGCADRHRVAGLLPRRLLGEDLVTDASEERDSPGEQHTAADKE